MQITLEQARAWALRRQGLAGPGLPGVGEATEATCGVYSSSPTCYLTYAARVPGFRRADLDRELFAERTLARLRCFHGMAYIVPTAWTGWVVAATGNPSRTRTALRYAGLSPEQYREQAERVESAMAGRAPLTVAEIRALLGRDGGTPTEVLRNVVALMATECRIVRAVVRGSWTSDAYAYARWSEWFGKPLEEEDRTTARLRLARHYFGAFGAATAADLGWWAGWGTRDTRAVLTALGDELAEVRLTGDDVPGAAAYAPAADAERMASCDPEAVAQGVALLPYWDAYTMGYHREGRGRIVAGEDRRRVYDKAGSGTSMLLADGVAAGVWEFAQDGETLTVRVAPFSRALGKKHRAGIEVAAWRLAAALGATDLRIETAEPTGALDDGPRNSFMSPIRLPSGG